MEKSDFYREFAKDFDIGGGDSSYWGKGRVAEFLNDDDFNFPPSRVREANRKVINRFVEYENIRSMPGVQYTQVLLNDEDTALSRVALEPLKSTGEASMLNMSVSAKGTGCNFYVGRVYDSGDQDKTIFWHNVMSVDEG